MLAMGTAGDSQAEILKALGFQGCSHCICSYVTEVLGP